MPISVQAYTEPPVPRVRAFNEPHRHEWRRTIPESSVPGWILVLTLEQPFGLEFLPDKFVKTQWIGDTAALLRTKPI